MANELNITAAKRTKVTSAVRRDDQIPAILYGYGIKNMDLQIDRQSFVKVFNTAGHSSLINLSIKNDRASAAHSILVREIQQHPVNGQILHIDLYQPRLDQAITADVPIKFVGQAPAVRDLGGVLVRAINELELEALPADLPHDIKVSISTIKDFDHTIHIKDLNIPDRVTLHHDPEEVVALVQPPRTEEELEALEEEVSEDVEGVEGVEEEETTAEEGDETEDQEKPEDQEENQPPDSEKADHKE